MLSKQNIVDLSVHVTSYLPVPVGMSSCKKRQVLLGFTKKGLAPLYVGVGEGEGQRRLSPESDVRVGRQGRRFHHFTRFFVFV